MLEKETQTILGVNRCLMMPLIEPAHILLSALVVIGNALHWLTVSNTYIMPYIIGDDVKFALNKHVLGSTSLITRDLYPPITNNYILSIELLQSDASRVHVSLCVGVV